MTSDERTVRPGADHRPDPDPTSPTQPIDTPASGDDRARRDRLDRYWDTVTGNGDEPVAAIAIDPGDARTVERTQRLAHDPSAGIALAARARIWRATVAAAAIPTRQDTAFMSSAPPAGLVASPLTAPSSGATHHGPNGAARRDSRPDSGRGPRLLPPGAGPARPTGRSWWPRLQFAVAAALILGLFATLVVPSGDDRIALFGGAGDDATPTVPAAGEVPSIGYPPEPTGGGFTLALPTGAPGHIVRIDRVTLEGDATLDLPAGAVYVVNWIRGRFTVSQTDGPGSAVSTGPKLQNVGAGGGQILTVADEDAVASVITIAPQGTASLTGGDGVTVYGLASAVTEALGDSTQALVQIRESPVSVEAEPFPLLPLGGYSNTISPDSVMLLYTEQGALTVESGGPTITDAVAGGQPTDALTVPAGGSAVATDVGSLTVRQAVPGEGSVYSAVFVQPVPMDGTPAAATPAPAATIPPAGYRPGFSGQTGLVAVPASGTGITTTVDRITLAPETTLDLPAGSVYFIDNPDGGLSTSKNPDPDPSQSPGLDVRLGAVAFGGSVSTDVEPVTFTILTIGPTGAEPFTTGGGVTVFPIVRYASDDYSGVDTLNVTFGSGPIPASAGPVGPFSGGPQAASAEGLLDPATLLLLFPERGETLVTTSGEPVTDLGDTTDIRTDQGGAGTSLTVQPGSTILIPNPALATIQQARPDAGATYTAVFITPVAPAEPPAGSPSPTGQAATPVAEGGGPAAGTSFSTDTIAADPVATMTRYTLLPGATLTLTPPDGGQTQALVYAAAGDASVTGPFPGDARTLSAASPDLAVDEFLSAGYVQIDAGDRGLTVYLLSTGTRPQEQSAPGTVTVDALGEVPIADAIGAVTGAGETPILEASLRVTADFPEGASQNTPDGQAAAFVVALSDGVTVTSDTGVARAYGEGHDPAGEEFTAAIPLPVGEGVAGEANATLRIAATDRTIAFLSATVRVSHVLSVTVPATPGAATPEPVADAACDIAPRTVDELLTLYDEGVAAPVDPFTLGLRGEAGTGTETSQRADPATWNAVVDTLRLQAACQRLGDPLRQYAWYSDAYLRYVLPATYDSRDQLAALTEQPAQPAGEMDLPVLNISDVEIFPDGRVGAHISLDGEFAYVTLSRGADGIWRLDLFDDQLDFPPA